MKVTLRFTFNNKSQDFNLVLGANATIGRSSKCALKLEDEKISSKHCRFNLKHDRLEITDLESKNGVFLNGIRIEQSEIFIGDEVKMGDTMMTIVEQTSDPRAIEVLSFPGPLKERLDYELKIDFTGVRTQNQNNSRIINVTPMIKMAEAHAREVEIRKRIKSKIRVSKAEIRARHKGQALLANGIDFIALVCLILVPVLFVPDSVPKNQRITGLLVVEGLVMATFLLINFKVSKFSFGEKLSSIRQLYLNQ